MLSQIGKAAGMMGVIVVNDFEGFRTTRREQKVMTTDLIIQNREHRITSIGIENVAARHIDCVGVINGATGRQVLIHICLSVRHQVGNLLTHRINHAQNLSAF